MPTSKRVINVSAVPHRSPFRYPGGKTWFVPWARLWLRSLKKRPLELAEPFAGGAIVGLTAAFEDLANKVTLVEIDKDVAAVWKAILEGKVSRLGRLVANFNVTGESVRAVLQRRPRGVLDRAFLTILRNRVQRGGILAHGAGLLKNGEKRKGIGSRWYPDRLRERIEDIASIRQKITFIQGDGLDFMRHNIDRPEMVFFIDPPYTRAAHRLYNHSEVSHRSLFGLATRLKGDFVMTYDDTAEVRALASECGLQVSEVPMRNTHHRIMTELVVGRDLSWLGGRAR